MQVTVNGATEATKAKRAKVLQAIEDKLTDAQMENLGKMVASAKAREYLGAKFSMLKMFI